MNELDRHRALEIIYTTGWFRLSSDATRFRILAKSSIPAVGPITALTWALEVGDVQRFSSIKKAISYCGCVRHREKFCERRAAYAAVKARQQKSANNADGSGQDGPALQPDAGAALRPGKLLIRVSFLVASLVILATQSWGADDGAALYEPKCAVCHGASGQGKPPLRAPALRGTTLTADQITERTMKGISASKAPHNKGISGISDTQAKAISEKHSATRSKEQVA